MPRHRSLASGWERWRTHTSRDVPFANEEVRERERALRKARERERRRWHIEFRTREAEKQTAQVRRGVRQLRSLLTDGILRDPRLDFDAVKPLVQTQTIPIPAHLEQPVPKPTWDAYRPAGPGRMQNLIPWQRARYRATVAAAEDAYRAACAEWQEAEWTRVQDLERWRAEQVRRQPEREAWNTTRRQRVDELRRRYEAGDRDRVADHCRTVLWISPYPDGFPCSSRVAYAAESREIVIDYDLPALDVVPTIWSYAYDAPTDEIVPNLMLPGDRSELYEWTIAAIALRSLHEVFRADAGAHVDAVAFNGYVDSVDRSTGQDVRLCLVSVRIARRRFERLDLSRIDPTVCLRGLGARLSRDPAALLPVEPYIGPDDIDTTTGMSPAAE